MKKKMEKVDVDRHDFQEGDKVFCLMFGKGIVNKISSCRLTVIFDDHDNLVIDSAFNDDDAFDYDDGYDEDEATSFEVIYRKSTGACLGIVHDRWYHPTRRTLYHGWEIDIDIDDCAPVRNKWVNFYESQVTGKRFFEEFASKESAQGHINKLGYITSFELKPGDPEKMGIFCKK